MAASPSRTPDTPATSDTRILLVRHGETSETVERRYPSLHDLPLTERGRDQALALGRALQDVSIDAAFTSESRRARETADLMLAGRGLALQALPELAEMGFGRLGGLTFAEATQVLADTFSRWQDDPFGMSLPEAEPFLDFVSRVRRARMRLSRAWAGRTIAVVTHGGVIGAWRCLEEGRPWGDFWQNIPTPGMGVWLIRTGGQVRVEELRPEG